MSFFLRKLMSRTYRAPAGEDGGEGGGAAPDRGDNLPDAGAAAAAAAKVDADAELARIAAEKTATEKAAADAAAAAEKETDEEKATRVAAEAAAAEEEANKKKDTRVPLSRHTEILNKERAAREAAEAEVAKLRGTKAAEDVNVKIAETDAKIVTLEAEYAKLMTDGDLKGATAKMAEIRSLERSISDQKTNIGVQTAIAQATAQIQYDAAVTKIEAAFPVLDPEHETFDAAQAQEIMSLSTAYTVMGLAPVAALQKAVSLIMKPATTKQEKAVEVEDKPDAAAAAAAIAAARKKAATEKAIEAAGKTPANAANVGLDSDKAGGGLAANVLNLSQADFAKLDDKTLASMRGDTL